MGRNRKKILIMSSTSSASMRKQSISTTLTTDLIESGKEFLSDGNIPAAVDELSEACSFLAKEFGDTAEECGEAYLYYGMALLELGRLENNVLCNALQGFDVHDEEAENSAGQELVENIDNMTKDEKYEMEEQVGDALQENFDKFDRIAKLHTGAESDSEDDSTEEEEKESGDEDSEGYKGEDIDAVNGAEEVGNFEAAWEVLELAKLALMKTADRTSGDRKKEAEGLVCRSLLALAEVSLENENYETAVEDLTQCLEKSKTVHPPNSRFVAEVQYQLGHAHGYLGNITEAGIAFNGAVGTLKAGKQVRQNEPSSEDRDEELAELESPIADIDEVVVELKLKESSGSSDKVLDGKATHVIGIERTGRLVTELAKVGGAQGPAMA